MFLTNQSESVFISIDTHIKFTLEKGLLHGSAAVWLEFAK